MSLHSRNLRDASLTVSKVLAAAAASASPSIDLGQIHGGLIEGFVLELVSPAHTVTSGKACVYTLQDSADNSTFADVDPVCMTTATASGTALAAKTVEMRLPPVTRRYVRINQATADLGGDASKSFVVSLLH